MASLLRIRLGGIAAILAVTAAGAAVTLPPEAMAALVPTPIPASSDWLTTVNYYRTMAGVAPVTENAALSAGAYNHSRWMVETSTIAHDEPASGAYTTPDGDIAGNSGNVAVSSDPSTTPRQHVELWMSGPFHAIGVLRPNLTQSGYGQYDNPGATGRWRSGATLNVLSGLNFSIPRPATPILFPGNGTTTSLDSFVTESPNPLDFCGWTGFEGVGLPLVAMMPEATSAATASLSGPDGPLEVCTIGSDRASGVARSILAADNAIVVVPRHTLAPGIHTATISTPSRTVTWSFTVDPGVADGPPPPLASTSAAGPVSTFLPLFPDRLVDSRLGRGASRLRAGVTTRIDVGGRSGVPTNAAAVSANFTIVQPDAAGFITVFPCGGAVPDVSTLNFGAGAVVPNQATVPLDATGDLCVNSSSAGHLLVDVNGALLPGAPDHFTPLAPERILDTRRGLGWPTHPTAGSTVTLQVTGRAGVPASATAVAINVTAVSPKGSGFVTVYPCGGAVPNVSSLNTSFDVTRPNLVITRLSAAGTVCLYVAEADADLLGDVAGYYSSTTPKMFTPMAPMRMLDTRSVRSDLNGGSGGARVPAGQTVRVVLAGWRGIPATTAAVSINLTVAGPRTGGFVTAFPCGTLPDVSNVNFRADSDTANAAQVTLDSTGAICLWSDATTHLLLDVNGVWG